MEGWTGEWKELDDLVDLNDLEKMETKNHPKGLTAKYTNVGFATFVSSIFARFALEAYGKIRVTVAERNKIKEFIQQCRSDIEKDLLQAPRKALFESLVALVDSLTKFHAVYSNFLNLSNSVRTNGGVRRRRPTKTPKTKK